MDRDGPSVVAGAPVPAAWNDTARPVDAHRCIHAWIEEQVALHPDATAVVFRDIRLSYAELNTQANRLAHHLRSRGVGPEVLVALYLERGVQMVVAILAVLKAGGAYVPLDASYPKERLLTILSEARAPVLVTQQSLVSSLAWPGGAVVCLDGDAAQFAAASPENPAPLGDGSNVAFALFTSGSTGTPKGVLVTHANLVNYRLLWQVECELATSIDAVCQTAFFSFAVFQGDVIRALSFGKKLVLCDHEALQSPALLLALMRREAVDFGEFVPAMLRNLVAHLRQAGERLDFMRVVVIGADRWYWREHLDAAGFLGPQTRFIHVYGSSETTLDSTHFERRDLALPGDQPTPIGRPFTNVRAYVLDADLLPVPVGTEGELCIGGAGVARGYLNRPELTAQKFRADPFVDTPGARLFRTGDIAKWLPDGELAFLGRGDQQVKIDGFRIELGEIEAALESHPQVVTGLVQASGQAAGGQRLVAYYLPRAPAPTPSELRRFLATKLPPFMLPSHCVALAAVPLTPSGKIDRLALPAVDGRRPDLDTAYAAPRDTVEQAIAEVWRELLQVDRVGSDDNFFELGGSSLLMVQAQVRLRQRLQREIPIVQMYRHPTVGALARSLTDAPTPAETAPAAVSRAALRRDLMQRRRPAGAP